MFSIEELSFDYSDESKISTIFKVVTKAGSTWVTIDAKTTVAELVAVATFEAEEMLYNKKERSYNYRNLPCTCAPEDKVWCVSGFTHDGSGVLEWCYDEHDAKFVLSIMKEFPHQFKELRAHPWKENNSSH